MLTPGEAVALGQVSYTTPDGLARRNTLRLAPLRVAGGETTGIILLVVG